jgi:hypothetical protein
MSHLKKKVCCPIAPERHSSPANIFIENDFGPLIVATIVTLFVLLFIIASVTYAWKYPGDAFPVEKDSLPHSLFLPIALFTSS